MEWKLDSTTYILPIDSIDVDLLSVRKHQKKTDAAPIPIWSANKPTDEYYEFEVYADTVEDDVESLDCVENQTTQPCHICNVNVPTAYLKEHYSSGTHKTLIRITENAMERSRKQISTEIFILDKKSDSNFFCTSCVEVIKLKNKNHHDGSKKHVASVKYDEFIQDFATAFMDRDAFIKNFDHTIEDEESKCTPNVENILKIDTNQQNIQRDLVHSSITSKSATGNDTVQENFEENTNLDNLLQAISSSMTNLTLQVHIGDVPGVTITFNTGYKVLVSMDNFHGLHRVTPHGPVQCRLCRVLVQHEEQHLTDTTHMQYVQRGIQDENCIRQLDSIWSHCVICNQFVENKQLHISSSEHVTLYNQALLLQPINVRPTSSVNAKPSTYCNLCNVFVTTGKGSKKQHRRSYEHRLNSSIFREENSLHHHMEKIPKNQFEVSCKICKIFIPRLKEEIKSHVYSEEHILRYNQMLEENDFTKIDEFQLQCGSCRKSLLEFELFIHIKQRKHKRSMLNRESVHRFQQKNITYKEEHTNKRTETFEDEEDDNDNFDNDITTRTFTNSNIVGMSLNQQIRNTNFATQDTASIYKPLEKQQILDKEDSSSEHHTQAVATYMFMQESTAVPGVYQPMCQPNTAGFGASQNDQKRANSSRTSTTAQPKTQVKNKPIMTKNYVHWLNINKLTPLSENNDEYHCGFCNSIMYKAAMFDHCNNDVHKSNVDKVASPKDGAGVKTEASTEDTVTTGEIAKTESPEEETAKTELKVGAATIELPKKGFYHCEVCRTLMPNTETQINAHISSIKHLNKLAKYDKICERKARREERLNKAIDMNNKEQTNTEVIISSETPSTSQDGQNKLCRYCKSFISRGTELLHVNSELHKKSVIESLEHEKSKNVVFIGATAVSKEDEDSYNSKIIKDAFNYEIGKPGTSSQPAIVQNTCKDVNVIQVKSSRADTVIESNDNYIVIFDKIAHCQLCNNSVKNIDEHLSARRHKYLESLISPNCIVWSNGKFFCNICSETIRDQSIFIHIESVVHKNGKLEYERNPNQKADGSNSNFSNTSELIFCTICNDYILNSQNKIKGHLKKTHADIMINISLYLDKHGSEYKCRKCNELFDKKRKARIHVLGECHLKIFTRTKAKVTFVEETLMTSDSQKKITDHIKKYTQEIEKRIASDDDVSKLPEEIFCEICKDNILVTQIRKHFKDCHTAITNMLLLEEFQLYFEEKGPNKYRCVHCDFMFYGKWNSLKHILGKHHYNLLTQPKTKGENALETSKGDLTNLINDLEKRVKEQEEENAARFRDMSCFDDTEKIHQDDNHSLVPKDIMIEKMARKGYDPFEEIEQDERSNIKQIITENETYTCIADDWWDLNDDFDDYIVFDDKAGNTANISEKYTEVWNDMYKENVNIDATTTDIPEDFDKTDKIKEFFCKVCRVRVPVSGCNIKIHVDGKKHKNFLAAEVPKVNFSQMAAALGAPSTHYNDPDVDGVKNFYLIDKSEKETLCRLCNIVMPNTVTHKREHLNGSLHDNKIEDKMTMNKVVRRNGGYLCNICVKPIRNEDIELHMESFSHKRAMNDQRTDEFSKRFFGNITLDV